MKKIIILLLFVNTQFLISQVGVGTTKPDPSSSLDVESIDSGVLFPRMTTAQKNAIIQPAKSLMIFDSDINCLSINVGTPVTPDWICLEYIPNSSIPSFTVSSSELIISSAPAQNYQTWTDVPGLSGSFTLDQATTIKIDWSLFAGQNNASTQEGFAQMFTILEVNNVNDPNSSSYLPMIHNPGGLNFNLLMNNSSFTYTKNFAPGTYNVKVRIYAASFLGSTNKVRVGARISNWTGGANMTATEKLNAASNKLIITYL